MRRLLLTSLLATGIYAQIVTPPNGGGGSGSGTVNSGTIHDLAYYAGTGTAVSGLATCNNGVIVTNGSGVPSCSTTLPSGTAVTSVSVVTANGVSGSVATATTTPAITLTLGAITPSSVSVGSAPALTPGTGAAIAYSEGTAPSVGAASGVDVTNADATLHCITESANNSAYLPIALGPASVTTGHLATWGVNGCLLADGGAGFSNPMTTQGDLIFENATPAPARLAIGGNGTFLGSNGTTVSWQSVPSSAPTVLISTSGPVSDPGGSSVFQFNNASGALTFNLQAGVAGYQRCYTNAVGKSGVVTVAVTTSNAISLNGVNGTTTTGTLVSGGSLSDSVCLVSDATNHWYAFVQGGAWTNN